MYRQWMKRLTGGFGFALMLLGAAGPSLSHATETAPTTETASVAPVVAPAPERVNDPTGAATGTAADIGAPGTLSDLSNAVGKNRVAINFVWLMVAGFLVMFMQFGFAAVETGMTRAKNAAHTMAMNFMIYPLGMIGFWVCGYALMMGGLGGLTTLGGYAGLNGEWSISLFGKTFDLLGTQGFFLAGKSYDVAIYAMFLFQMVFMDTTATIPTGAMAERWKFSAFCLYGLAVGTVLYPVYGNWVWGGGWLADLGANFGLGHGHVDFAGSSVVHLSGGVLAFVGAKMIGPRIGKFNSDGSPNALPGHNLPMAILGTFVLCFCWFGFNAGSTLAGADLRLSVAATNTMLAGAFGALTAMLWMWLVRTKKPDPGMMCNGTLAGLVAITAPCAFVNSVSASLIGAIAGVLVIESCFFVEGKLKIDDPVGAISVHGVNGAWGCLALGLFADGTYGDGWNGVAGTVKGLFYGDARQFLAEAIGIGANVVYMGIAGYIVFKVIDVFVGHRVGPIEEVEGLDVPEMGCPGYVGIKMDKHSETPLSR